MNAKQRTLAREVVAEYMGTLLFAFMGGAAPASLAPFANGFALVVVLYWVGPISGGHVNPAVSLAMLVTKEMDIIKFVLFVVAQLLGSITAAGLTHAVIPSTVAKDIGCFVPSHALSNGAVFGWEFILTFLLVSVIYAVAVDKRGPGAGGPAVIGLTVFSCALTGGGYTGASMNPARTLGPSVVYGCISRTWLYYVANFLAAPLASLFYHHILQPDETSLLGDMPEGKEYMHIHEPTSKTPLNA